MSRHTSTDSSVRHILQQVQQGQTLAAADHLLVRGRRSDSAAVVERLMSQLPGFLTRHSGSERDVFTTLIRIGLNLVGQDAKVAEVPPRAA